MNSLSKSRTLPVALTREDLNSLDLLDELVTKKERPALVGREGKRVELPDEVFHHLVQIVRNLRAGKTTMLFPANETLTTQAAADLLGVSRPFLVGLLERAEIPHHKVGAHRRIYLKDLVVYQQRRDANRHAILDRLAGEVESAGLYESDIPHAG